MGQEAGELVQAVAGPRLRGACNAYWAAVDAGTDTTRMRLLCGKEMFFYEGFDTIGVPTVMLEANTALFPELIGSGGTGVGMIEDPTSAEGHPLGFGPGQDFAPGIPALAFTCASCHLGQLPDGRYAMGAPNHDYEYGELNLAMALAGSPTIAEITRDLIADG